MSIRIYRPLAFSALLAGSLCLLAGPAAAAPSMRSAKPVAVAVPVAVAAALASPSLFVSALDAAWTRLLHLFAGDHGESNGHHGGHSGGDPDTDEGPGMCPHGH